MVGRAEIRASLRALFGRYAGDRAGPAPDLPDSVPAAAAPLVRDAVAMLTDYQGVAYARLYLHRLKRFVGRREVDDALFGEIARLMAARMAYEDPVRLAQLTLAELDGVRLSGIRRHCRFRFDELVEAFPSVISRPALQALAKAGWSHRMMTRRYSAHNALARVRLRLEAGLRRWRGLSHCYERERRWVERWLHMIDRALTRQPEAAPAIVSTATMIRGYGDAYRRGLADWDLIIDRLAKPTFDGEIPLPELAGAIAQARRAAQGDDAAQTGLRAAIAALRAGV